MMYLKCKNNGLTVWSFTQYQYPTNWICLQGKQVRESLAKLYLLYLNSLFSTQARSLNLIKRKWNFPKLFPSCSFLTEGIVFSLHHHPGCSSSFDNQRLWRHVSVCFLLTLFPLRLHQLDLVEIYDEAQKVEKGEDGDQHRKQIRQLGRRLQPHARKAQRCHGR